MKSLLLFFLVWLIACNNPSLESTTDSDGSYLPEQGPQNKVVGISDGDTFRWLTGDKKTVRIRLHGIDAPEKGQGFGTQSRQALSDLILEKSIRLEQKSKDQYGRIVAIAYVNGLNVNEEMLQKGLVWHYKAYDKNERWASLEEEARKKKRGLWREPKPVPPWQWRKDQKEARAKEKAAAEKD